MTAPARAHRLAAAPRHLLSSHDLGGEVQERVLAGAATLREQRRLGRVPRHLAGRQIAMLFEKPSLRTRVTFDVGISALGGHAVYLSPDEVGIGHRETATDVGRNLSRWVDAIVFRTFGHDTLVELASAASVPVINALSDHEHPCQALADLMTLRQHLGELQGRSVAFVGDGNNVCHSLLLAGSLAGIHLRVATPRGYEPDPAVVRPAIAAARRSGGSVRLETDPAIAVSGVDAVYTDAWTSMGAEAEADLRRLRFAGYRVDASLLAGAPGALVMHCLPAHRGEEISDEAIDGPSSVVLDQAENRLYVQQALLVELLT
ncbi:MAG TPA: ornithine carbamoyltransferase, partial [Candidatus Limnocylindria bacterium]|nr:ornithine carbamoyltransferase [Candidatus Limnocylindria bacterium]